VLDCIRLYGMHELSSFPIDVWIRRAVTREYSHLIKGKDTYRNMRDAMVGYFGRYSGYAQAYLYNYFRLNKIK
jgi:hypothetical protein